MRGSKICFKCSKTLPLAEFYVHPQMADGHLGKCKECAKVDVQEHRIKNLDRIRAYDRARAKVPERMKKAAEISKRWRQQDSRIMKCHNLVTRSLRKGLIEHQPCSICGRKDAFAHHEDYNKPLEIIWYCQPHHSARHKEMAILGIDPLRRDLKEEQP